MKVRDVDALAKELKRDFTFEKEGTFRTRRRRRKRRWLLLHFIREDCDRKKLSRMKMVKNGELILQGKSSCMPAHCLLVNEREM